METKEKINLTEFDGNRVYFNFKGINYYIVVEDDEFIIENLKTSRRSKVKCIVKLEYFIFMKSEDPMRENSVSKILLVAIAREGIRKKVRRKAEFENEKLLDDFIYDYIKKKVKMYDYLGKILGIKE